MAMKSLLRTKTLASRAELELENIQPPILLATCLGVCSRRILESLRALFTYPVGLTRLCEPRFELSYLIKVVLGLASKATRQLNESLRQTAAARRPRRLP